MSDVMTPDHFVNALARQPVPANVYNPYAFQHQLAGEICRQNLVCYLDSMVNQKPKTLLVGEALGYRGGRLTGIPFTSERLLEKNSATHIFDFSACRLLHPDHPTAEATATIMWNGFNQLKVPLLLWNAFPYHPHKPEDPTSNRPPKAGELKIGFEYLSKMLVMFDLKQVIAVGRKADHMLSRHEIGHVAVRHPSHGGKTEFLKGLFKHIGQ
ncbi:MAG: uracil-DNA glycosylase [Chloroflexota bacterium]